MNLNPLQDLNPTGQAPQDSIWERHDAKDLYLIDQISSSAKKSQIRDLDYNFAAMGMGPDEIDSYHEQQRKQEFVQGLVAQGEGKSDTEFKKMLEAEVGNQPKRTNVGPPQLGTEQAIIGALAAILDPQHAAQSVNTVLGGAVNARDREQAMADQDFEIAQQQHNERVQILSRLTGIEQDEIDRRIRQQNFNQQLEIDREQLKQRGKEKQASDLAQAGSRYNASNSEGEKRVNFADLNRIRQESGLDPFPDTMLEADLAQMSRANQKVAAADWEKALSNELNQFGEVDDNRAKDLEIQRQSIARDYGINPDTLRTIPTTQTLKAQAFAQRKAEFKQKFDFGKQKWADTLADKLANRDLAERRFMETQRHNQASESIMGMNNMMRWSFESAKQYDRANKEVVDGVEEAINGKNGKGGLRAELAGKRNRMTMTTDKKEKEKIQGEIAEIQGQIDYLNSTKQPFINDTESILRGEMDKKPNPNYRGDPQNAPFDPSTAGREPLPNEMIGDGTGRPGPPPRPRPKPQTKQQKKDDGSYWVKGKKISPKTTLPDGTTFSFGK